MTHRLQSSCFNLYLRRVSLFGQIPAASCGGLVRLENQGTAQCQCGLFLVGSENRDKRLGGRVIKLVISHVIMPDGLYLGLDRHTRRSLCVPPTFFAFDQNYHSTTTEEDHWVRSKNIGGRGFGVVCQPGSYELM